MDPSELPNPKAIAVDFAPKPLDYRAFMNLKERLGLLSMDAMAFPFIWTNADVAHEMVIVSGISGFSAPVKIALSFDRPLLPEERIFFTVDVDASKKP